MQISYRIHISEVKSLFLARLRGISRFSSTFFRWYMMSDRRLETLVHSYWNALLATVTAVNHLIDGSGGLFTLDNWSGEVSARISCFPPVTCAASIPAGRWEGHARAVQCQSDTGPSRLRVSSLTRRRPPTVCLSVVSCVFPPVRLTVPRPDAQARSDVV